MKTPSLNLFVAGLFLVVGCQKEPVTKPVYFTETEYVLLTPHDDKGKPLNLEKESISADLLSFTNTTLPEGKNLSSTNPGLLNQVNVDMRITKKSAIYFTFVKQATINKNAIAFYTYPTNNPPVSPKDIKKIIHVFPNAGNSTALLAGNKIKIGEFEPGVSVGIVLLKDAWNADSKQLNNQAVHFCYNDALNPEVDPKLKKHVVLIDYPQENKILIGFEDVDRTSPGCDHDFNDVILYATITDI